MKKIIKKSKYILAGSIFFVSMLISSKWFDLPVEKAIADAIPVIPDCYYRDTNTGLCYTLQEYTVWSARTTSDGSDAGDGIGVNNNF